jgi:putative peptidoglycan lipid II flippase
MSLVKSSATIGFFTLISRISGFMRDVVMANMIGASYLSDAFFIAFKLPNFFRRLFAEGAFNAAFVPSFAAMLTADGKKAALRFASEVLSLLIVILLALNVIFIVFMPFIMPFFAPGFLDDSVKFDLTVTLARLCFPYIFFISIVSLLAGILNSMNRFSAPAFAPVLLNICLILGLLYLSEYTKTPAHALAMAVFIAGIVQCGWLVLACWRADALPSLLWPKFSRKVKTMLWLMMPAAIGSGVQQVNLLVDMIIASHLSSAVSYLYYADRIVELPIGMIGVAVGTALLPMLSKLIKQGDKEKANHHMNRGLEIVLLFGLPAMFALLIIGDLVVAVIYEHGAFSAADRLATSRALLAFSAGLPAFLAVKILAPGFYANHDTKTPLKIALICVVINLVLNLSLIGPFGHVGMAIATSTAGWVNALLMLHILRKRALYMPDALIKIRLLKMLVASAAMALVLALLLNEMTDIALPEIGMLLALITTGLTSYGLMLLALKIVTLQEVKRLLLR